MLFRGKNRTEEEKREPYGFLDVFSQSLLFCQDKVAGRGTKGLRDIAPINAELHYVQFLEMDAWKVWRKLST